MVVDTVNVDVIALPPATVTVEGLKEHVGAGVPPVIALHEMVIWPVYPLAGATWMVEVADPPAVRDAGDSADAERP